MIVEQNKYIAVTKTRILCAKGWILKSAINTNQIKTFESPTHIKQFFENQKGYPRVTKYEAVKVKVTYEIEEDE